MSVVAGAVTIVAEACQVPGGDGLGDQFINPTGNCELSAFHVQLSLAGGITDPFHLIFKVLMTITWAIYQFQVIALAWVTDFVLGMSWLDWFTGIAGDFQDSIAGMLSNLNMYAAMLTITAFVCMIWMARGMWGKGLVQLLLSLIIANYAVAAISYDAQHPDNNLAPINPITWLVGDNDNQEGLLYDARDTSQYLVGQIVNDDDYLDDLTSPENEQVSPGESILSTFLYHPAMLVNFGYILDGDCEEAYVVALSHAGNSTSKDDLRDDLEDRDLAGRGSAADGVDTGSELTDPGTWWGGTGDEPVDYDPEVWKVVGSCLNDEVDTFAKMARPDSWMAQFAIQPAVTILAVLILIIAGVVFIAGLSALVQCIKLLITLLLAILPGGARSVLWRNVGQLFATVLMLMFCIVFLGVFLHVVTDIMAAGRAPTGNPDDRSVRWAEIGKFLLIDLLLIAGIVLFWRGRGAVHETKDRVAAAMASKFNPGGGGGGGGFGGSSLVPAGSGPGGAMRRLNGFNAMGDAARNAGLRSGGGQGRLQGVIRRTSGLVGHVGMAWATGGGSLAVKGGAMAAKSTVVRGAARGAGGLARRGAIALGESSRNVAQGGIAAARRSRVGVELARTATRSRGRMQQFGAWTSRGGADLRNRYRGKVAEAGQSGHLPVDGLRSLAHRTRSGMADGVARMAGGRFGTAGMSNRAYHAREDAKAGLVKRNYERRMRAEEAQRTYQRSDDRYQSARAQADLTRRRHKAQADAEAAARQSKQQLRRRNRDDARREWERRRRDGS
ncbi:hypothetical protein [Jiangella alkaliphila]|uniref:TrbL/VirB6 plasmid conjugal transfer protein n=1 Tax=Jiangella alkaliphila TaxID=419479 RepID=A0A1H2HKT7_9ACTN|nr:hypothetical protein [Jiangella alkaliphila]SDU32463.1 hypothetical protein SAMN04488563_1102 [Jiangella alkaliphila]